MVAQWGGQTLFSSKDRDIGVTDCLKLDLQSISVICDIIVHFHSK